jgi:hypothetical protein
VTKQFSPSTLLAFTGQLFLSLLSDQHGYGDILPTNTIEITVEIFLVFSGVALYSYIISKLSNLFSSVKKDDSDKTRDEILSEFAMMQSFSNHLKKKVQYFFRISKHDSNLIFLSKEFDIESLITILPPHLKAEMGYYLYIDAIKAVRLL